MASGAEAPRKPFFFLSQLYLAFDCVRDGLNPIEPKQPALTSPHPVAAAPNAVRVRVRAQTSLRRSEWLVRRAFYGWASCSLLKM